MNPVKTLILFPFRPRAVMRAHRDSSLARIYGIHLLGLIALWAIAWSSGLEQQLRDEGVIDRQVSSIAGSPEILAITFVVGELIFTAVATVMTCWAGGDESVRDSWLHALRCSWLYVAHLWWLALVTYALGYIMDRWVNGPALGLPLLFCYGAIIVASIVSYLRALTVDRPRHKEHHEPNCEWCGYNLSHIDEGGLCPECGTSIPESLKATPRRPLELRTDRMLMDFLKYSWISLFDSETCFRNMAASIIARSAVVVLGVWITVIAAMGGLGAVCTLLVVSGAPSGTFIESTLVVLNAATNVGMFVAWCFFIIATFVATFLGWTTSRRVGRNRLAAAFQVVACTAGVLPLWAGMGTAVFVYCLNFARGPALVPYWFGVNGLIFVLYTLFIASRMKYVQYANT